ncbi:MAG: zinc-ribbon domain-containing protein, partial [Planctomyces sp.]|nr:zinc-ribbon domain-containing protein [Planctomyces sp.]
MAGSPSIVDAIRLFIGNSTLLAQRMFGQNPRSTSASSTSDSAMPGIFETITRRLAEVWRSDEPTGRGHSFRCQCGRPLFFRNSICLGCQTPLGFEPESLEITALESGP